MYKITDLSGRPLPETFSHSAMFGSTVSLHGRRSSTGLCFATETGTHSANSASNKVEFVPVVVHDRGLVQTVLKPVEVPQVRFAGDDAVLALFFGCRQAQIALIADHGGFLSWFHW